ncbi:MAG: hypothetical protein COA63_006510 [Methylophaga sp.]|nr:hypothetical protein [Methylophaga sp.]
MSSFTTSESSTFTITHAKYLASKVVTDLKRIQRFYDSPSDSWINSIEKEITLLLKKGYLGTVTYGFQRNREWIEPTLQYTANELINSSLDDDPGKIKPGKDVSGAHFTSYLTYSGKWDDLTDEEKGDFKSSLPFKRTGADEPSVSGYLENDLSYSSGGRSLSRNCVRSY